MYSIPGIEFRILFAVAAASSDLKRGRKKNLARDGFKKQAGKKKKLTKLRFNKHGNFPN